MKIGFVVDPHLKENPPRSWKMDYFPQIMDALNYVIENNNITVVLGDLFDKPSINDEYKVQLVNMLLTHKVKGKRIYSIVGNHDIYNYNGESVKRTSLGLMDSLGLVQILQPANLGALYIDVIEMKRNPTVPKTTQHPSVLVGHVWYEVEPHFSVTKEQIKDCGFDYLILGHDHEPHPPVKVGNTVVLRVGSISRNTSHEYNLKRQPHYLQFVVDDSGSVKVDDVEIPAPLPSEIFYEDAFKKRDGNVYTFVENISAILKGFDKMLGSNGVTVKKALDDVGAPEPVKMYIKSLHERAMVNF